METLRELTRLKAIYDRSLSRAARLLYLQLDVFADGKPETAGITPEVLAASKRSARTMKRYLRELIDAGYLYPAENSKDRYEFHWAVQRRALKVAAR